MNKNNQAATSLGGKPGAVTTDGHSDDFLFYTTPDGQQKVEAYYQDETVWLTQKKMADLFDVDIRTVNEHLTNIYATAELTENSTIRKIRIVQTEGSREVSRAVNFYNLDAIISVGYRVNSRRATDFRRWATSVLREYMIKGFALDNERLKNGSHFGQDYFADLLEQIREIRASERRFYQKITDLYALSADYDKNSSTTREFFATVQNKLLFAVTGQTAAELKVARISSQKKHLGLTTWKNSPHGKIMKNDLGPAKNVLSKKELQGLNRIVSMYLDYAEDLAERGVMMYMEDWASKLNSFLQFQEREILQDAGRVSAAVAEKLAETEYLQTSLGRGAVSK